MTDRIELRGLRWHARHGVLAEERRDGQDFVVDVALELDMHAAADNDDLSRTVDYGALSDRIAAVVTGEPVRLLETLATRIAEVCLAEPNTVAVEVSVHKPQAPIRHRFDDVVVRIRRGRA